MNTHYGIYGGQYVAETLMPNLLELEQTFNSAIKDQNFLDELKNLQRDYIGRESPLYFAKRLSEYAQGAKIYLKREDLNHTGAHKINNAVGQALLAERMGKKKLIAETGAGMHGVATATVAALLGMECKVFMGSIDVARQSANVSRMRALGSEVVAVESGSKTLKDAMNEALRYWVANSLDTFYVIGTAAGPYPYPQVVRYFQSVIGEECRRQILTKEGKLPREVIACVGGGSNAIGIFSAFIDDAEVKLTGAEAAGKGIASGQHAASINGGRVGVLHGSKSYLMQDENGQIIDTYSISAGLDYPGVGPEHSFLADSGRAEYTAINDDQALEAFDLLCKKEGIIPALESSHAVAQALISARKYPATDSIIVSLSGRGDKDLDTYLKVRK
ncbi:MAG: tryptophan synthase subunit beta [Victivallaceae bacterium]